MFEHVQPAADSAFQSWERHLLNLAIEASLADNAEAQARADASNAVIDARLAREGPAKVLSFFDSMLASPKAVNLKLKTLNSEPSSPSLLALMSLGAS